MLSKLFRPILSIPSKRRGQNTKTSKEITFDREIRDSILLNSLDKLLKSKRIKLHELTEQGCSPLLSITNSDKPIFRIITHIHGDEPHPGEPLLLSLSELLINGDKGLQDVSYIPRANAEAFRQGLRGIRADDVLATLLIDSSKGENANRADMTEEEIISLLEDSGINISYDSDMSIYYVDLNRQFRVKGKEKQGAVPMSINEITFPKAKLLLRESMEVSPKAEYVFSFHADNRPVTMANDKFHRIFKANNGCYIYDIPYFEADDKGSNIKEDTMVLNLMKNVRKRLKEGSKNITLLTGYDDVADEALGLYFEDGYARTPVVRQVGDGPYEDDQVLRGFRGENSIKRAFVFETPTWLTPEDIQTVITTYLYEFVVPFMNFVRSNKNKQN